MECLYIKKITEHNIYSIFRVGTLFLYKLNVMGKRNILFEQFLQNLWASEESLMCG